MKIRQAALADIQVALDWAADEGWNPGLRDAVCFQAADPQGFLIGELDGEPVATVSAVRYHDEFGFIGLYIVRPDMRDRGYGMQIWMAARELLGDRNVGLDAVVEQAPTYERDGFRSTTRTIRHEARGRGQNRPKNIVDLPGVPFHALLALDERGFPAPRPSFLRTWTAQPETEALGIEDGAGGLAAYGVLRRCRSGWKIGPLFAIDPGPAAQMLDALLAAAPKNESVYFDTPEVNAAAVTLATERDMQPVFETYRMYSGADPEIDRQIVFGVTTLELG